MSDFSFKVDLSKVSDFLRNALKTEKADETTNEASIHIGTWGKTTDSNNPTTASGLMKTVYDESEWNEETLEMYDALMKANGYDKDDFVNGEDYYTLRAEEDLTLYPKEALEAYANGEISLTQLQRTKDDFDGESHSYEKLQDEDKEDKTGTTTVILGDSGSTKYSVDTSDKKGHFADFNSEENTDKSVKNLLTSVYYTKDSKGNEISIGNNDDKASENINSAAWAFYDNNKEELYDAVNAAYLKATGKELPINTPAEDIDPEIILSCDLSGIDNLDKLIYSDISELNYKANATNSQISSDVRFDTKQSIDLDKFVPNQVKDEANFIGANVPKMAGFIAKQYNIEAYDENDNLTPEFNNLLKEIVKSNPKALEGLNENSTSEEILTKLIDLSRNGNREDDYLSTSLNTLNFSYDRDSSKSAQDQIIEALINQYDGIENKNQLLNSVAGQNILNTILLDGNNNEIFDAEDCQTPEEIIKALAAYAKAHGDFTISTLDTSVNFISSKEISEKDLKSRALNTNVNITTSYLPVETEKIDAKDIDGKTYLDLLDNVQYENGEKGSQDSVSLKDKIESAKKELDDIQTQYNNETDEAKKKELEAQLANCKAIYNSLETLGVSAIEQIAQKNKDMFPELFDENGNFDKSKLEQTENGITTLTATITIPNDKKDEAIELQPISYVKTKAKAKAKTSTPATTTSSTVVPNPSVSTNPSVEPSASPSPSVSPSPSPSSGGGGSDPKPSPSPSYDPKPSPSYDPTPSPSYDPTPDPSYDPPAPSGSECPVAPEQERNDDEIGETVIPGTSGNTEPAGEQTDPNKNYDSTQEKQAPDNSGQEYGARNDEAGFESPGSANTGSSSSSSSAEPEKTDPAGAGSDNQGSDDSGSNSNQDSGDNSKGDSDCGEGPEQEGRREEDI